MLPDRSKSGASSSARDMSREASQGMSRKP